MKKLFQIFFLVLTLSFVVPDSFHPLSAQCPMCRMTGESNLRDGGTQAKGLNKGIIYMLTMPYLLVGTIGYFWWRNNRKKDENED